MNWVTFFQNALADAEFVIEERLEMQSLKSMALECRALLPTGIPQPGCLTSGRRASSIIWSATASPSS